MGKEPKKKIRLICLKCGNPFMSPNKIKIRRCQPCKHKAYGDLEGFPDYDDLFITNKEGKKLTVLCKDLKPELTPGSFNIKCHEIEEKDFNNSNDEED